MTIAAADIMNSMHIKQVCLPELERPVAAMSLYLSSRWYEGKCYKRLWGLVLHPNPGSSVWLIEMFTQDLPTSSIEF